MSENEKEKDLVDETQSESQNTEGNSIEITINDLTAMKNVIEMCSQRGVFKPNEMIAVGTLYSKLDQFLKAVAASNTKT